MVQRVWSARARYGQKAARIGIEPSAPFLTPRASPRRDSRSTAWGPEVWPDSTPGGVCYDPAGKRLDVRRALQRIAGTLHRNRAALACPQTARVSMTIGRCARSAMKPTSSAGGARLLRGPRRRSERRGDPDRGDQPRLRPDGRQRPPLPHRDRYREPRKLTRVHPPPSPARLSLS